MNRHGMREYRNWQGCFPVIIHWKRQDNMQKSFYPKIAFQPQTKTDIILQLTVREFDIKIHLRESNTLGAGL
jgi:hypothetical protein